MPSLKRRQRAVSRLQASHGKLHEGGANLPSRSADRCRQAGGVPRRISAANQFAGQGDDAHVTGRTAGEQVSEGGHDNVSRLDQPRLNETRVGRRRWYPHKGANQPGSRPVPKGGRDPGKGRILGDENCQVAHRHTSKSLA